MIQVTVVSIEGGLPSTTVVPVEIFSGAGVLWRILHGEPAAPLFQVRSASIDGGVVRSWVPVGLEPSCSIDEIEHTDLIVIAAVVVDLGFAVQRNAALLPWLQKWRARGAAIAGVCSGVALMAEASLLDDRPATTHWGLVDACRRRYPRVNWQPERFVTESDGLFCSGGVYSSIDLSLYLVEKYGGHEIAMQTAKSLLLETPRTWQMGYAAEPPRLSNEDPAIQKAQEWLFRNFKQNVRIEDLAAHVGMSPRNFARRFKFVTGETPIAYLHGLRINAAKHLLENELKSIRQVSQAVGYEDVTFFRRLFRRYTGAPPRSYRDRFGTGRGLPVPLAVRAAHR